MSDFPTARFFDATAAIAASAAAAAAVAAASLDDVLLSVVDWFVGTFWAAFVVAGVFAMRSRLDTSFARL